MAHLLPSSPRATSCFSLSTPEISPYFTKHFLYRLLLALALLPLFIFLFAFFFQWRGAGGRGTSPIIWQSLDHQQFPEASMLSSTNSPAQVNSSSFDEGVKKSPIVPDFRSYKFSHEDFNLTIKICITSTTSADLDQVLAWVFYHKVLGVTNFFLFVEGKAAIPRVSQVLETIPGLQVIHRTRELEEIQAKSPIWNDTGMSVFFNKPCNNELFVKQSLNMETAVVMAREAGMEWILHLDTDELLHPAGTTEYSIRELLTKVPKDVDMVVFPNYESAVERDNVREPFYEVSLFKKNFDHLTTYLNSELMTEANRGNPYYFLTYSNGKAAARLQDQLYPAGAHRWHIETKTPKEISMNETAVLHFTYSRFSDLTTRRNRCSCKPIKEGLERCIFLEFDRNAFIIASTATKEEMLRWYQEHVVWNDETLKLNLLKSGVLTRIYTPMVILRGLRQSGIFTSVIASAQTGSSRAELSKTGNNTTVGK